MYFEFLKRKASKTTQFRDEIFFFFLMALILTIILYTTIRCFENDYNYFVELDNNDIPRQPIAVQLNLYFHFRNVQNIKNRLFIVFRVIGVTTSYTEIN